jgi:hypothetical protein
MDLPLDGIVNVFVQEHEARNILLRGEGVGV